MNKLSVVISGALVFCLLVVTIVAYAQPTKAVSKVTLANYEHQGEFTCTSYSIDPAATTESPLVLFSKIIDRLDILYTCDGPDTNPVAISMTLEDANTGWQKRVPVEVSGGPVYSFPLDIKQLLDLGNAINTELGGRGNSYLLHITAVAGTGNDAVTTTLEGTLSASSLVWQADGFNKVERGFPGKDVLVRTAFGYRAQLIDNSLFGAVAIERPPAITELKPVEAGISPGTDQVKYVGLGYSYRFLTNANVQSLGEEWQIDLTLSEAEGWSKTYKLIEPVAKDKAFDSAVYLDIAKLLKLADTNDTAAGGRVAQERQITINARVHTVARTDKGVIDEVFQQQLTGKIGKLMTWSTIDKSGKDLLSVSKAGQLTSTTTTIDKNIQGFRLWSTIALSICLLLFSALLITNWRRKPEKDVLKELKANRKKYNELISEVDNFPINGAVEKITNVPSMESLVKISNNSLKPILLKVEQNSHFYRVIDGPLTYQYIVSQPPAEDNIKAPEIISTTGFDPPVV